MKSAVVLGSLFSLAAAICDHGTTHFPRSIDSVPVAKFGFNDLTGPLNWHGLDTAKNSKCAVGKEQSPINIDSSKATIVKGKTLGFHVQDYHHGAEFENLGSTVEVIANGTLTRDGKDYSLAQFHFHTPSEHRVDSEYYPMEVHFVFQAADASLSVLGFLIEIGTSYEASNLLQSVFAHVEDIETPGTVGETGPLKFHELKRHLAHSDVYQYGGSLTTPPCTEGIKWNVVRTPLYVDIATYRKAKKVMKFNSRYTQDVPSAINLLDNARVVLNGLA